MLLVLGGADSAVAACFHRFFSRSLFLFCLATGGGAYALLMMAKESKQDGVVNASHAHFLSLTLSSLTLSSLTLSSLSFARQAFADQNYVYQGETVGGWTLVALVRPRKNCD